MTDQADEAYRCGKYDDDQHHWVSRATPVDAVPWISTCSICGALNVDELAEYVRAAEQRVSDPAWIEGLLNRRGEERYAAGVQAARDAVAALGKLTDDNGAQTMSGFGWNTALDSALAAIDALRGES